MDFEINKAVTPTNDLERIRLEYLTKLNELKEKNKQRDGILTFVVMVCMAMVGFGIYFAIAGNLGWLLIPGGVLLFLVAAITTNSAHKDRKILHQFHYQVLERVLPNMTQQFKCDFEFIKDEDFVLKEFRELGLVRDKHFLETEVNRKGKLSGHYKSVKFEISFSEHICNISNVDEDGNTHIDYYFKGPLIKIELTKSTLHLLRVRKRMSAGKKFLHYKLDIDDKLGLDQTIRPPLSDFFETFEVQTNNELFTYKILTPLVITGLLGLENPEELTFFVKDNIVYIAINNHDILQDFDIDNPITDERIKERFKSLNVVCDIIDVMSIDTWILNKDICRQDIEQILNTGK